MTVADHTEVITERAEPAAAAAPAGDPSLAPDGHELIQALIGLRPGETLGQGETRIEALMDSGFRGWRERETWRRRMLAENRTGAVDPPGCTWRDRPAIDRGSGVYLAGDLVAAPGMRGEVSVNSALTAARHATAASAVRARHDA